MTAQPAKVTSSHASRSQRLLTRQIPYSARHRSADTGQLRTCITAAVRAFSLGFSLTQRDAICRLRPPTQCGVTGLGTPSRQGSRRPAAALLNRADTTQPAGPRTAAS